MQQRHEFAFFLTTVFVKDKKTGNITAFFAQFPEASAEGRTKKEAKKLLEEIFPIMIEDKGKEFIEKFHSVPNQSTERLRVYA